MFSIDVVMQFSPFPISIQRKEAEGAEAAYQEILAAMRSEQATPLELTCEKDADKKIAVMSNQISAVVVSQKSGGAEGRVPGFFMQGE